MRRIGNDGVPMSLNANGVLFERITRPMEMLGIHFLSRWPPLGHTDGARMALLESRMWSKANETELIHSRDNHQRLCLTLAFWNGKDKILKERLYGLNGEQGVLWSSAPTLR